ncbi:30S ribosomal protein S14 [Actinoplanes bogorensis]|uniref:Small ribosomal subunit protein uS14 n=1 Tax=Paractinoplanes bogorensis TaxID=1610840 RepID=A0ABS5Z0U2_9ACTN|nr:30S ribosomal protein S14 [Actinoplanes bogorensis]MBU2668010.1 30S ribosomal protein S14 [Actinoplanes bogorensis]
MARRALIEREKRRAELSARLFGRRAELKRAIAAPSTDPAERADAVRRLAAMPRDASPTRRRSRDLVDGRPRGVLSRFGLSRVRFRQMAHEGQLPGIRKASW